MNFPLGGTAQAGRRDGFIDPVRANGAPSSGHPVSTGSPPRSDAGTGSGEDLSWTFDARTPGRRKVLDLARRAASSTYPILILGPTGVGKEVLAGDIHRNSPLRSGPFVAVNCAAITPSLFESQFFGHVRGSFTGATANQAGLVELAHGGTLFLDEVGELSTEAQAKLLRFLAKGTYWPVGAAADRRANVRIIAATHRPLDPATGWTSVREDFYFRLSVVLLRIPPLAPGDIHVIAQAMARAAMSRDGLSLEQAEIELLASLCAARTWRGGARELSNAIDRLLALRDPTRSLADTWMELLHEESDEASKAQPAPSSPVPPSSQAAKPGSPATLTKQVDNLIFLGIARECRDVRDLAERTQRTIQAVYGRLRKLALRPGDVGPTPKLMAVMRRLHEEVEPELPWIQSVLQAPGGTTP